MASSTPKFGFRKPDGADPVNVTTDINENFDKIEKLFGAKTLAKRNTGSLNINAGGWYPLYSLVAGADMNLTIKATVGDWIEVGINGIWETSSSESCLDCVSTTNPAVVATWGGMAYPWPTSNYGLPSWRGESNRRAGISGGSMKQIVAADINGAGNVVIGLIARSATLSRTLFADGNIPLIFFAINRGSNV